MKFLLGIVVGLLMVPAAGYLYFRYGNPPVAVADTPFPFEKQIVKVPLHARIDRDMPKTSPLEASAANLTAGAQVYHDQCAECHGVYGHGTDYAAHMYPPAPQLWEPHAMDTAVVGVSDDPVGETYWKVANGIRLTGMPSFDHVLSPAQMWQVSLLLKHADSSLPPAALTLLETPLPNTLAAPQATPNAPPMAMPAAPSTQSKAQSKTK